MRNSLLVGAMVAARYNPQLKSFRDKLVAAGKPKLIALVAVARKLITVLNAILRDRRSWQQISADRQAANSCLPKPASNSLKYLAH